MSDGYIASVQKELQRLSSRQKKLKAEIEQIAGEMSGIQKAAQLFFEHTGAPVPSELQDLGVIPHDVEGQTGSKWQSILSILKEAAPEGLTSKEIVDLARKKNIQVKARTVSSQLSRAKSSNTIQFHDGKYYYSKVPGEPQQDGSNGSISGDWGSPIDDDSIPF